MQTENKIRAWVHGQPGLVVAHSPQAVLREALKMFTDATGVACDLGLMTDALWTENSNCVTAAKSLMQQEFGLDIDDFIDLARQCQAEVSEIAELFGVELGESIDCERLIEQARQQHAELSLVMAFDLDSLETSFDDHCA